MELSFYFLFLGGGSNSWYMQALIHFESTQSRPKQIDYLESLVVKFIEPNSENPSVASVADREELSSIFLEVCVDH